MEHEIAGQAVKAAMDGALVGTADRKKEPSASPPSRARRGPFSWGCPSA